jgi:hypothetical protein
MEREGVSFSQQLRIGVIGGILGITGGVYSGIQMEQAFEDAAKNDVYDVIETGSEIRATGLSTGNADVTVLKSYEFNTGDRPEVPYVGVLSILGALGGAGVGNWLVRRSGQKSGNKLYLPQDQARDYRRCQKRWPGI